MVKNLSSALTVTSGSKSPLAVTSWNVGVEEIFAISAEESTWSANVVRIYLIIHLMNIYVEGD